MHLAALETLTLEYEFAQTMDHAPAEEPARLVDALIAVRVSNLRLVRAWLDACSLLTKHETLKCAEFQQCLFMSPHYCKACLREGNNDWVYYRQSACHGQVWHAPADYALPQVVVHLDKSQKLCRDASCRGMAPVRVMTSPAPVFEV
jgi:hypothetical protein